MNSDVETDMRSDGAEPAAGRSGLVGKSALAVGILLGPLLAVGSAFLKPEGSEYPNVRARTVANVILVTMDEIAPEDLPLYNSELPEDEFLNEFARLAVTVNYAYGPTSRSPSAPASFLTGQLPSTHGVLEFSDRSHRNLTTIAQLFDQRGSETAAITNLPLLSQSGLGDGFRTKVEEVGVGAQVIGDHARKWLKSRPEEYVFLWVHHHLRPAEKERRGEVFSKLLEQVTEGLKESRKYEGSFIFASGTYGRTGGSMAVPMLVKIPKRTAVGATRNGPCSTLDVIPTLQEIFNLRTSDPLPGRSLVSAPNKPLYSGHFFGDDGVLFEQFAPRTRERVLGFMNHKYVLATGPGRGEVGLYDTASDPTFQTNLLGTPPADRAKDWFLQLLVARRERIPRSKYPSKSMPLPPEVKSTLQGMGLVVD